MPTGDMREGAKRYTLAPCYMSRGAPFPPSPDPGDLQSVPAAALLRSHVQPARRRDLLRWMGGFGAETPMPIGEHLQIETLLHLCFSSEECRQRARDVQGTAGVAAEQPTGAEWVDQLTEDVWEQLCDDPDAKRDMANVATAVQVRPGAQRVIRSCLV